MRSTSQRCRRYKWIVAGRAWRLALLLCWLSAWMLPAVAGERGAASVATLEVMADDGERLVAIPLAHGARWCMGWNHSVAEFPVLDCYRYRNGNMVLERSHQPDFAAGLGHIEGRGEQVSDGEGGYWIENINEPVPDNRYVLRVGSADVDHRLIWLSPEGKRQTSLSGIAAGQRVIIQVHRQDDV